MSTGFAGAWARVSVGGALVCVLATTGTAGTLITLSSTSYNGSNNSAQAYAAAIDGENVIVTGYIDQGGGRDVLTVKYNPDLTQVLSQATFPQGGAAQGNAVTADSRGNIIVAGQCPGSGTDVLIVKYSSDFSQVIASAVFDSGGASTDVANGVTVDAEDNIIVAGSYSAGATTGWLTLLFDSDLTAVISSVTFTAGSGASAAYAVAVGVSSDIVVVGQIHNGANADYLAVKYGPALQFISSATYNGTGNGDDIARGILIDDKGNVWVTGESFETAVRCVTLKYDAGLTQVFASVSGPDATRGRALEMEPYGTVVVAGEKDAGSGSNGFIVRYSTDLARIVSEAEFRGMTNGRSEACGMVVNSSGSILVAGYKERAANLFEFIALRYNGMPVVAYVSPENVDQGDVMDMEIEGDNFYPGATVMLSGTGITLSSYAVVSSSMIVAYIAVGWEAPLGPRDVTVMNIDDAMDTMMGAFAVYNGSPAVAYVWPGTGEQGAGVNLEITGDNFDPGAILMLSGTGITISSYAVAGSTVVTAYVLIDAAAPLGPRDVGVKNIDGAMDISTGALTVINALPVVSYVWPETGERGARLALEITGDNFDPGAVVTMGGTGITVSSYAVVSSTVVSAHIVIGWDAPLGPRDVSVTNFDGGADTMPAAFAVRNGMTVELAFDTTVYYRADGREVKMEFLVDTFDDLVTLFVSTAGPASVDRNTLKPSRLSVDIAADPNLPPLRPFTMTITYRDSDIDGLDESRLVVGWFDEGSRTWIVLPSTVYPAENRIVVRAKHLSRFAILQLVPAGAIDGVKAFPNPFNPGRESLIFENLTAEASINVFTIAGEQVRNVEYTDGSGRVAWDGKNNDGNTVASGVYIVLIKSSGGTRRLKVAAEK